MDLHPLSPIGSSQKVALCFTAPGAAAAAAAALAAAAPAAAPAAAAAAVVNADVVPRSRRMSLMVAATGTLLYRILTMRMRMMKGSGRTRVN